MSHNFWNCSISKIFQKINRENIHIKKYAKRKKRSRNSKHLQNIRFVKANNFQIGTCIYKYINSMIKIVLTHQKVLQN